MVLKTQFTEKNKTGMVWTVAQRNDFNFVGHPKRVVFPLYNTRRLLIHTLTEIRNSWCTIVIDVWVWILFMFLQSIYSILKMSLSCENIIISLSIQRKSNQIEIAWLLHDSFQPYTVTQLHNKNLSFIHKPITNNTGQILPPDHRGQTYQQPCCSDL